MNKKIKEYVLIILGLFLVAIGITYILIPNDIVNGGTSGLSIILNHYFSFLPVGLIMLVLNIVLFTLGIIFVSGEFGLKTIICSIGLSGLIWLMQILLPIDQPISKDPLAQVIISSVLTSIGLALTFIGNASTGGTDIIAKIINKYLHIYIGRAMFLADILIVLVAIFTFGVEKGIYGLLGLMINAVLIDYFIRSLTATYEINIISKEHKQISDFIGTSFKQSATIYKGYDAVSSDQRDVIRIILRKKEFQKLRLFVNKIDPNAYITSHLIYEYYGFKLAV